MLRIAHRGAKGYGPENTLAAFEKAMAMGADGIELDVHLSADGKVVVMHDATLDRMTGAAGTIAEMEWQSIQTYRVADHHPIPLLETVIELLGPGFFLNIELKVATAVEPVLAIIEAYVAKGFEYEQFLVSSFDWVALQEVRERQPKVPIGVLTQTDLNLAIAFARSVRAEAVHPYFHLLSAQNVLQMQEEGFRVFTWTVNEPGDIALVKSYLVDGIISDYTDRL